jgi:lipopolysaccharide export system protein LptA
MVKMILSLNIIFPSIVKRSFLVLFFLFLVAAYAISQTNQPEKPGKRRIEVNKAAEGIDEIEKITGKRVTRLIGDVSLTHNEVTMLCDSAHFYPGFNQIKAFSRIHMEQGDTLDLFGDSLYYDGMTEMATVNGNVELVDKETHLFTDAVLYNISEKIATYTTGGRITNGQNTLTSVIGIYYASRNLFSFKDSVKIVNPDYTMFADTMDYNTRTETAFFTGPSELIGDSLYLYCEKGWYDTKNDISHIWKNAVIDNRQQLIRGDSLFYDSNTGYGKSYGNTSITDTTNNIVVKGHYAWYYKEPERFMVTDSALFIQISGKDSLFLHADTINAVTVIDTAGTGYRLMRAFYGCRIFSDDLQGKCDSLSYSFQDSVIRMYNEPVIWSEENQLTSDSVAIFTKNRKADEIRLYNSSFVISQVDDIRFNQVKGRNLTGYFRDNELYKINIEGNGETIYYLLDQDEIVGINKAKCARFEIFVSDGKITEIYEYQNPEGEIDPPSTESSDSLKLEGFMWLDNIRPKNKKEVFEKFRAGFEASPDVNTHLH